MVLPRFPNKVKAERGGGFALYMYPAAKRNVANSCGCMQSFDSVCWHHPQRGGHTFGTLKAAHEWVRLPHNRAHICGSDWSSSVSTWISLWICREYVHRQSDSRGWVSRRDSKTNGTPNFSLSSTEAHPTPSRPSAGISPILSLTWAITTAETVPFS